MTEFETQRGLDSPDQSQPWRTDDDLAREIALNWTSMKWLAGRLVPGPDSEEICQEAALAAWRLRHRFQPELGSAKNWLLSIVADHSRRHLRRRRLKITEGEHDFVAVDQWGLDLDLENAVAKLSARQQLAVALFYYLDRPVSDVAQPMECREGTVKSTFAATRKRLHSLLEGKPDEKVRPYAQPLTNTREKMAPA